MHESMIQAVQHEGTASASTAVPVLVVPTSADPHARGKSLRDTAAKQRREQTRTSAHGAFSIITPFRL